MSVASSTELANLALSHLGSSNLITALDDRTTEARMCNLWWPTVRDDVLRSFPWPFAIRTADLALVETFTTGDWGYSYTAPADALRLIRSPYGSTRNPSFESETRYRIADGLLYLDQDLATIEYVERITDMTLYPADVVTALSYLLAARIANSVTTGTTADKNGLVAMMEAQYERKIGQAKATALNEQVRDVPPESGFITARA